VAELKEHWAVLFVAFVDGPEDLQEKLKDGWEPYAVAADGHYLRKVIIKEQNI